MHISIIVYFIGSHQGPHEKRLLNHLLTPYNVLERPVANESEPLEVKFGLTLQQIIDVVSIQFFIIRAVLIYNIFVVIDTNYEKSKLREIQVEPLLCSIVLQRIHCLVVKLIIFYQHTCDCVLERYNFYTYRYK